MGKTLTANHSPFPSATLVRNLSGKGPFPLVATCLPAESRFAKRTHFRSRRLPRHRAPLFDQTNPISTASDDCPSLKNQWVTLIAFRPFCSQNGPKFRRSALPTHELRPRFTKRTQSRFRTHVLEPAIRNSNTLHIDIVLDEPLYIGALLRVRFYPKGISRRHRWDTRQWLSVRK